MPAKQLTGFCTLLLLTITASAQKKELGDDQFFKNNFKGITQPLPSFVKWIDDSHFVLRRDGKSMEVDCKTGTEKEYTDAPVNKGSVTVKPLIVTKGNDLYERKNVADIQLTSDDAKEVNPTLSPDGKYVAYTKNNDLYALEIATKKENRLTSDGSETVLNGYASWVYMEEILGRSSQYRSFWWSPDSKTIAFFRTDESKVPVFTITDAPGQHGVVEHQRYPKAGDPNPEIKIGFANPDGGALRWADFNAAEDQYFPMPYWKPDGSALWIPWANRGQDKLVIYETNPQTGAKKEVYSETQKTWIDIDDNDRVTFLQNGKGFLLLSDRTGWRHIYHHDMMGKLINPVTSGNFTVIDIDRIDEKNGFVYFVGRSRENSARRDYYRVKLNGKDLTRLTFGDYSHQVNLSPDGGYLVTTYSNVSTAPTMALVDKKGKLVREIASSKGAEFANYNLAKTEMVRVKSEDGLFELPMRVVWPINMEAGKKYPVLISIYGGPNAGNCWDTWGLNGQQQFYAKEGLIQVVMDHRASGHFGKEGVNYMHRNLGYWEMKDYGTMAKWLIENRQADPAKICITGFSYGGYMSCYALTFASDIFTHGMAGGSVTDWSLYDAPYTERFMDTPGENPEGYKSAAVLTHAAKYKGMLQMVHGSIDDNVHLQNTIQFVNLLQDAKKDFEVMYYGGNRHGIGGPKALHFQNMKTKFIYKYLLEKPVPKEMLR
jgi:dipeptidyl-peptidase 4